MSVEAEEVVLNSEWTDTFSSGMRPLHLQHIPRWTPLAPSSCICTCIWMASTNLHSAGEYCLPFEGRIVLTKMCFVLETNASDVRYWRAVAAQQQQW